MNSQPPTTGDANALRAVDDANALRAVGDANAFRAVLEPNPPLSNRGSMILIGCLTLFCVAAGLGFFLAGAWLVTGFLGVEFVAFVIAFVICRNRALRREHVCVDRTGLTLETIDVRGRRQRWSVPGHWACAHAKKILGERSCLVVVERGKSLIFGRFLRHDENISLAFAINRALREFRTAV